MVAISLVMLVVVVLVASLGVSVDNMEKDLVWLIRIGLVRPDIDLTSLELERSRADVAAIINICITLER